MTAAFPGFPLIAFGAGALLSLVAATLTAGLLARAGFPLPPAERRIGRVDGLRGYLALSVLLHHFAVWTGVARLGRPWSIPPVPLLNELGAGAVALFFMTTGLVFYPRVLSGLRATVWPTVFTTRAFRILPLVAVSVAVVLVVDAARFGPRGPVPARALVGWLTAWGEPPLLGDPDSGRINAYVLWSLKYEWIFYLAILPLCALARDAVRGRVPNWAVPLALLVGGRLLAHAAAPGSFFRYLPLFAAGMLAFEVQTRAGLARALRSRAAALSALAALALAVLRFSEPYGTTPLLLFAFFFACVACGNDLFGLLATRGALVLGECSFGIYLLHGVLLSVFFTEFAPAWAGVPTRWLPLLAPLVALAAALVTPVTYLLVERPMIRQGARLARRWTGRRVRADAQAVEVAP